ncbi:nitroreductase family protein [Actinotalea sp. K2]|uniref:nitroreductase family protein n=1 Tax=Actinotalea sp. K2 TaxID=2939438 RepID=UPI0020183737|nr:nitroreductase family protein [Actinotalea sp. K2]MCL3862251.1 nitroreductase family protein [Actinotalea sp. K2]
MEFQQVVSRRRMVRSYSADPVPPAVVDRMLQNALRAPSAGFSQGWAFLVLDRPADVDRFWRATTPEHRAQHPGRWLRGMRTAPVVVVPMSCRAAYVERYAAPDKVRDEPAEPRWSVPYWHIDTGMAALLILQTAVDEHLGACFFGIPPDREHLLRAEFTVPDDLTPIGAITIGHPADQSRPTGSVTTRRRTPLHEVVRRGQWSTTPVTGEDPGRRQHPDEKAGPGADVSRVARARPRAC